MTHDPNRASADDVARAIATGHDVFDTLMSIIGTTDPAEEARLRAEHTEHLEFADEIARRSRERASFQELLEAEGDEV